MNIENLTNGYYRHGVSACQNSDDYYRHAIVVIDLHKNKGFETSVVMKYGDLSFVQRQAF